MVDRFAAVAVTGEPAFRLSATILHEMAVYAKEHFAADEALLPGRNCPILSGHLDAHRHFQIALSDLFFMRQGNLDRAGLWKYIAEGFEVHRHTHWAELQKRYRNSNSKHWDRILSGLGRSHETYSVEPAPKSADGAELTCQLGWGAGKTPQGVCRNNAGAEYQVRFD